MPFVASVHMLPLFSMIKNQILIQFSLLIKHWPMPDDVLIMKKNNKYEYNMLNIF